MSNFFTILKQGFVRGISEASQTSSFDSLAKEIGYRISKPLYYFPFWVYFIIVTLLMGLAGVFTTIHIELLNSSIKHSNITLGLATYFIALLSSSTTDLILSTREDEYDREIRALGIGMILLGVGLFLLSIILPKYSFCPFVYYIPPTLGTLVALFSWWMANAHNPNLTDKGTVPKENTIPRPETISNNEEATRKYNI